MTANDTKKDWSAARSALRIHSIREITLRYEGTDESVITRVPDVSTTGMFVNTSRHYEEGAVLNLQFCLELSGLEVQARGEVRYCLPGVGVGVQFIDVSEKAIRSIEKEIDLTRRARRPVHKVIDRKLEQRKRSKSKSTPHRSR